MKKIIISESEFNRAWGESWTHIKTVVDIIREPILILDKKLCVLAANEPFYRIFHVEQKDTEGKFVYELGDGQWNIPQLKKLLETILPKETFFKGFEVSHNFPTIGHKIMMLNARKIYPTNSKKEKSSAELLPPIILLAIEDVTAMITIAKKLADHTNALEVKLAGQTDTLPTHTKKSYLG